MSATNRGEPRHDRDFYQTPQWLIDAIVPKIVRRPTLTDAVPFLRILDPGCGDGRIGNTLKVFAISLGWQVELVMYDIEPQGAGVKKDFFEVEPDPTFDIVAGNPPFTLAQRFVDHGRKFLNPHTSSALTYLLRINFLGAQSRASWHREWKPSAIYISPRRPSFKQGGKSKTDATEYAWIQYDTDRGDYLTNLQFLETEYTGRRKKADANAL